MVKCLRCFHLNDKERFREDEDAFYVICPQCNKKIRKDELIETQQYSIVISYLNNSRKWIWFLATNKNKWYMECNDEFKTNEEAILNVKEFMRVFHLTDDVMMIETDLEQ
jgi:hypothetical protein